MPVLSRLSGAAWPPAVLPTACLDHPDVALIAIEALLFALAVKAGLGIGGATVNRGMIIIVINVIAKK